MKTFINKIKEFRKKTKETKRKKLQAYRRSNIMYCLKGSDIKYENLIPILDEEYARMVVKLEERVKREKMDDPKMITNDRVVGYKLPNIFSWGEIVISMKTRVKDAYYIKNHPCVKCGEDNTILFCFRSNNKSWRQQCGREGYMYICPDCLTKLGFKEYLMD